MGRAPCCTKIGLKKGPWTTEEDEIMKNYIIKYGHGNWRALPKRAGLLRCGKSCRLRWVNYLKPDIRRGSFTKEEEDLIIKLHEELGNRWSSIAAKLPGRTDNEIKNVWHTSLKKKLNANGDGEQPKKRRKRRSKKKVETNQQVSVQIDSEDNVNNKEQDNNSTLTTISPAQSFSEFTSLASDSPSTMTANIVDDLGLLDMSCFSTYEFQESLFDETYNWFDQDMSFINENAFFTEEVEAPQPSFDATLDCLNSSSGNNIEFWLKVFGEAGGWLDLPEI